MEPGHLPIPRDARNRRDCRASKIVYRVRCLAEIETNNKGWRRMHLNQLDPAAQKIAAFQRIEIRPATAIWRKILPHGSLRPFDAEATSIRNSMERMKDKPF
jgi:hypothetical protein